MKKYLFTVLNYVGMSRRLRRKKKNTITVLSLHRISNEKDYFWSPVTPATFEKLLQYAVKYYTLISFKDIPSLKKGAASRSYMILSFDDGYLDFYDYALPLLKKYGVPCNHNIVNECAANNAIIWTQRLNIIFNHCKNNHHNLHFKIKGSEFNLDSFNKNWMKFYLNVYKRLLMLPKNERTEILVEKEKEFQIIPVCRMMNWSQIEECSEHLVEIGCHTFTHDSLSTINDSAILAKEIIQSADEIEEKIAKEVNVLALPNGAGNGEVQNILKGSAIKYILFVNDKINDLSMLNKGGIEKICRINIVEESIAEMILRIELFHSKFRRYA